MKAVQNETAPSFKFNDIEQSIRTLNLIIKADQRDPPRDLIFKVGDEVGLINPSSIRDIVDFHSF